MNSHETDIVLSAIRRGEDSLPKLRAATGLEYAKLHVELHKLEFEWRSIQRFETADGFSRYAPTPSERSNGNKGVHWSEEKPIPPAALVGSKLGLVAREISIIQRNAPYCVGCRGLCILHGTDQAGRIRWRCKPCGVTFAGSGAVAQMNRIRPEKREQAIAAFKDAKSVRQVASEVGISKATAAKIRDEEKIEALCPCGESAKHQGWCPHRYQNSPARQAVMEKMHMGHSDPEEDPKPPEQCQVVEVDNDGDTNDPNKCVKCGASLAGMKRVNLGRCSDCWLVYLRECAARRKAEAQAQKSGKNITETITALPEIPTAKMEPKSAIEFRRNDFCMRNCDPPTVGHHKDCLFWPANRKPVVMPSYAEPYVVEGFLRLNITMNISIAEMQLWNPYDISSFFSALATLQKLGNPNGSLR